MSSILVRAPNWIGDQILAYPFFFYLREAYPRQTARITVACAPWVESLQFRDLIDEVVVLEKPERPGLWAKFSAVEASVRKIRTSHPDGFDLGISLPDSASSAWFLLRARARRRRGYGADGRGVLLTEVVRTPLHVEHRADAYQKLLPSGCKPPRAATEFWGIPPVDDLDPGVPGVSTGFDPERAWPGVEAVETPPGDFWVLAPGSSADTRRWPVERFIELSRRIGKETGLKGVIVGGLPEVRLAMKITEELGNQMLDRVAQGPPSSLWKLFRKARFTVSNDSGLAHVASLCGSRVHVVWGAGDPKRTQPIGPGRSKISLNPIDCWPCERNHCSLPAHQRVQCLKGIDPDAVWEELKLGFKPH